MTEIFYEKTKLDEYEEAWNRACKEALKQLGQSYADARLNDSETKESKKMSYTIVYEKFRELFPDLAQDVTKFSISRIRNQIVLTKRNGDRMNFIYNGEGQWRLESFGF